MEENARFLRERERERVREKKRYLIQKKKQLTERFDCATRWPLIDPFAVKENGFVSININFVKGT